MNFKIVSLAVSGILTVGVAASAAGVFKASPGGSEADLTEFKAGPLQGAIAQNAEEQTNIRVYERASPAVVTVTNADKSNGSGTIISPDGIVLTNAHVVSAGGTITIILSDGRKFPADVVGFGEEGLD